MNPLPSLFWHVRFLDTAKNKKYTESITKDIRTWKYIGNQVLCEVLKNLWCQNSPIINLRGGNKEKLDFSFSSFQIVLFNRYVCFC